MAGFTQYEADLLLGLVVGTNVTALANKYLAIHTGNPGSLGTANEASYTGYARIPITTGQFAAISAVTGGRTRLNNATLNWPANGGVTTVNVSYVTMWDAISGGNCRYVYDLPAPVPTIPGNIPTITVGILSHIIKVHQ